VATREQVIGATVSLLRDAIPQQAVADAMRQRGHKWSQSTVWAVEKGERRLLLSEAADLAQVLDVSVEALLKRPDEVGLQSEIAGECRSIGQLYNEAIWTLHELAAAHDVLQGRLDEAERKGFRLTIVTEATIHNAKKMMPEQALEEAEALKDRDNKDRPRTREDFYAMRTLARG
jgi:hypothetical protein